MRICAWRHVGVAAAKTSVKTIDQDRISQRKLHCSDATNQPREGGWANKICGTGQIHATHECSLALADTLFSDKGTVRICAWRHVGVAAAKTSVKTIDQDGYLKGSCIAAMPPTISTHSPQQ